MSALVDPFVFATVLLWAFYAFFAWMVCALVVWAMRTPARRRAEAAAREAGRAADRAYLAWRIRDDHERGHCWAKCPHCKDAQTVDFWSPMQPNAFAEDRERARLADLADKRPSLPWTGDWLTADDRKVAAREDRSL